MTLFVLLKMGRLTDRDLADCELALSSARARAEPIDERRLVSAMDALPATDDASLAARRRRLRLLLSSERS